MLLPIAFFLALSGVAHAQQCVGDCMSASLAVPCVPAASPPVGCFAASAGYVAHSLVKEDRDRIDALVTELRRWNTRPQRRRRR